MAELLHATGRDWDRRAHRVSVLARGLPVAVSDRWAADRPDDGDALVLRAFVQSPRGQGTLADMMDFAWQSAFQAPHGSPIALLPVAARVEFAAHRQERSEQSGADALNANAHWSEPRSMQEIDRALSRAHRPDEAALVFQRIGRHMTAHPWDLLSAPERTFRYWRDQVSGRRK